MKRSGESLASCCSWWDPEDVATVVRGRDEDCQGAGGGVNDLLVVLPHGRSVADVLDKVGGKVAGPRARSRGVVCVCPSSRCHMMHVQQGDAVGCQAS